MSGEGRAGVSARAARLVERMIEDADMLRLAVSQGPDGCRLVDAGASVAGGIEAGRRLAEIAMGGYGQIAVVPQPGGWPFAVNVGSADPVIACLGSQYAGWSLKGGDDDPDFFALGSGPGRAQAGVEALFAEIGFSDRGDSPVFVLETDRPPPASVVAEVARACSVEPAALTFLYAPTRSLAGSTQVVARVLEVALHRVHALGFPLQHVVDGLGTAPLPPVSPDFVTAMGRTNDAIIYGGRVHLSVLGPDDEAEALATALPAGGAKGHGRPFAEIFAAAGMDFYAIDPGLFAPAEVIVTAIASGRSFRAGRARPDILDGSFSG